jgi:hypothetical protein
MPTLWAQGKSVGAERGTIMTQATQLAEAKGMVSKDRALGFMLAGNCRVTFLNTETGNRFTYRIRQSEQQDGDTRPPVHFVQLLNGPDNETMFTYMGTIFGRRNFKHTKRSKVGEDTPSFKVFQWVWRHLESGSRLPDKIEIWHEGRCGRCGRALTVPSSIELGIGPECASQMGV